MTSQIILDGNGAQKTVQIFVPGTAGTASPDVQTVQGVSGMTPIILDLSGSVGATPFRLISAATTNGTNVKASAGTLYMLAASNSVASSRFIKFYNKASSPSVGTDTPVFTFLIPGNSSGDIAIPTIGLSFTTGISFAITGAVADADTTAIGASDVVLNIAYK